MRAAALVLAALTLFPCQARATDEGQAPSTMTRGEKVFWLNAAEVGVLTAWGVYAWRYGASKTSHMQWEGGFGDDTKHGGSDKLGHAFTGYLVGRTFSGVYADWGYDRETAALMGVGSSLLFTTLIEVGDSFSDFGASPEDFVANAAGAAAGYLFARYPEVGRYVDWRIEYWPKNSKLPADPTTDYERMKHHLVLKLSGFPELGDSPLAYGEVHAGYYTRGFAGTRDDKRRNLFFGVGVNLARLLEPHWPSKIFNYYQPPLTHAAAPVPSPF